MTASDPEKQGNGLETSSNGETEVRQSSSEGYYDPDANLSEEEKRKAEKKLLWKIDMHLIPWLCFLYLICFLDRTNIGNAKIAHLTQDIPMTTHEYSLTLTIFFISYAFFEPIANFLLKYTRPSIFIPAIMVGWGACMLGMGFVKNWSGLMAARWFLGVTEAGLYPGVNFYLSCWYKRTEFGVRAAIFFSAAALAGSFGGLLAAAIQNMDGIGGHPGWAWIFILEGLLTMVVGIVSFWMVHDFPDEAKFLTKDDRARLLARLRLDNQSSAEHEEFKMGYVWEAVTDWKTYNGMFIYMGTLMPLYSFSLFLPSIIQNMSFTSPDKIIVNQLLSVPPYAGGAILTIIVGFASDRFQKRGIFNMCIAWFGIVGFTMMLATTKPGVQYAGTFLGAMGIYPCVSLTVAWVANNIEGVYKRGIVLGMVIGWGNLNGVVSSNVYFNPPRFFEGHGTIVGYQFLCLFCGSVLFWFNLRRENKARLAGKRDHLTEGKTTQEIEAMHDRRPNFLYTL